MKTQYFSSCTTLPEVKRKYFELAMLHHPEKGGDYETMREINNEYKSIFENLLFGLDKLPPEVQKEFFKFPIIICRIHCLNEVIIEMVGDCLWASGKTHKHYQNLKLYGFSFSQQNSKWCYPSSHSQITSESTQCELSF